MLWCVSSVMQFPCGMLLQSARVITLQLAAVPEVELVPERGGFLGTDWDHFSLKPGVSSQVAKPHIFYIGWAFCQARASFAMIQETPNSCKSQPCPWEPCSMTACLPYSATSWGRADNWSYFRSRQKSSTSVQEQTLLSQGQKRRDKSRKSPATQLRVTLLQLPHLGATEKGPCSSLLSLYSTVSLGRGKE